MSLPSGGQRRRAGRATARCAACCVRCSCRWPGLVLACLHLPPSDAHATRLPRMQNTFFVRKDFKRSHAPGMERLYVEDG